MQKIGEGFYYRVYDIGNGRVSKKLTTYLSRVWKLIVWGRVGDIGWLHIVSPRADRQRLRGPILQSRKVLELLGDEVCGNPVFVNELEYEQDKAMTLKELLPTLSDEQFLSLVREYVAFQKRLWSLGLSDTVFKFTQSMGISEKTGKLICTDFNEITESKEKAMSDIARKKWQTQSSLRWFPLGRTKLKKEILKLFDQEFNQGNLDKFWKK